MNSVKNLPSNSKGGKKRPLVLSISSQNLVKQISNANLSFKRENRREIGNKSVHT